MEMLISKSMTKMATFALARAAKESRSRHKIISLADAV